MKDIMTTPMHVIKQNPSKYIIFQNSKTNGLGWEAASPDSPRAITIYDSYTRYLITKYVIKYFPDAKIVNRVDEEPLVIKNTISDAKALYIWFKDFDESNQFMLMTNSGVKF